MVRLFRAALVLSLALLAREASANWFRTQAQAPPAVTAYYHYPMPVVCLPTYPVAAPAYVPQPQPQPAMGVPAPPQTQQPGYAKPSPAPPSNSGAPAVDESRRSNYYDAYAVEQRTAQTTDRCKVGIWNQSGQDLTVTVAGQLRVLQRGQGMTLELPKKFVWQIEGREVIQETIADAQAGVDIVIRR